MEGKIRWGLMIFSLLLMFLHPQPPKVEKWAAWKNLSQEEAAPSAQVEIH